MNKEYKARYRETLKLSEKQLDRISALRIVNRFIDTNKLEDLPNINPDFIENWRDNTIFPSCHLVKKSKKGHVFEFNVRVVARGINRAKYMCTECGKDKPLNFDLFCKECEKSLKSKRKYTNAIFTRKFKIKPINDVNVVNSEFEVEDGR